MLQARTVALMLLLLWSAPARADNRDPSGEREELRFLDPSDPDYRTPRAGEGFRTRIFGRDVEVEPRDRRSTSALSLGAAGWHPRPEGRGQVPFFAAYFWRRPDEQRFFRGSVSILYNDLLYAHSLASDTPFEVVLSFENDTVPFGSSALWADGERITGEELEWGWVRGGVGLGYRRQLVPGFGEIEFADHVDPQTPDNMFAVRATLEPKYLYFSQGDDASPFFVTPQDTFELQGRLALRWDALERNLLDLSHHGYALGFDGLLGWRANWEDWGLGERAGRGRDWRLLQAYAVVADGVPGLGERHRLIGSLHGGWGGDLDRFSRPRLGGGPGGDEYLSLARAKIPGATISEFTPDHYVSAIAEYRYELFFFTYLSGRTGVAWLDRDRLHLAGIHRQNDVLTSVGGRLTTGFFFESRLQVDYNYNFDVIREGDRGGNEWIVHLSRPF